MRILIVEDDRKVASFLKKGLQSEGHVVSIAYDGEDGLFRALEEDYELVLLDVILPKLDGVALCKKLRLNKKTMPIIMLTAKDAIEDRVEGLDAGADDYLVKPFSFTELMARIRSISRRYYRRKSSKVLKVDGLILDSETFEVRRDGKDIKLSATEFKLLKYLMENCNHVVSRTEIFENVWGYDFDPESNLVEVYIKYLRDKVDKGFKKSLIQTIHGIGYKLCA